MSPLSIEVWFDLICPWCFIGKRHLDTALERIRRQRPVVPIQLAWHSYPLLPDTPADGLPFQRFYLERLGSPEAVAARRAQVYEAGRRAGITFDFDRIEVLPNTLDAHRLVAYAKKQGGDPIVAALLEQLHCAYFLQGENIGDRHVLAQIAADIGLDRDAVVRHLLSGAGKDEVRQQQHAAQRRQVSGVPCFVINNGQPLTGAQPADVLFAAMAKAT
jgi:predicted DsbA family dithiol-disulfide isomerase